MLYVNLLTNGGPNDYLADIEEQVQEYSEEIMEQMKQGQGYKTARVEIVLNGCGE